MDGYILTNDGTNIVWEAMPTIPDPNPNPKQAVTGKCPCCGSRQFVSHQSRRICAYCRSEQDGQAVTATPNSAVAAKYEFSALHALKHLYGYSVLRPEKLVRITHLTEGKTDGKETVDA